MEKLGKDDEYKSAGMVDLSALDDPSSLYSFFGVSADLASLFPFPYNKATLQKMRSLAVLTSLLAGHALAYPKPSPQSLSPRDWPTINEWLSELADIMPIGDTVSAACDLIGDGEDVAADLFGISNTENEPCGDVTVLFARGTCDPGNVGVLVGPWFFESLQNVLGSRSLGVQGVPYPASVQGFLSGAVQPGIDM